jgi:hypothetical protein
MVLSDAPHKALLQARVKQSSAFDEKAMGCFF